MNSRTFVSMLLLALTGSCQRVTCRQDLVQTLSSRPNILILCLDSVRPDYFNSSYFPAVHSRLRNSVRFSNAYANAPWTIPSVATVFTGRLPSALGLTMQHGVPSVPLGNSPETLASILTRHGYSVVAFSPVMSLLRGVGLAEGFAEPSEGLPEEVASPDAVRTLMSRLNSPWVIWFHTYQAHWPYPDGDYVKGLSDVDLALGGILEEVGQDTLVLLLSDHGEVVPPPAGQSGHGYDLTDEQLRTVLLFDFPATSSSHNVCELGQMVQLADLTPTLLDLAGAPIPGGLDGASLLPSLKGKGPVPSRHIVSESPFHGGGWVSLRNGEWQVVWRPQATVDHSWWEEHVAGYPGLSVSRNREPSALVPSHLLQGLIEHLERAPSSDSPERARFPGMEDLEKLRSLGYVGQ